MPTLERFVVAAVDDDVSFASDSVSLDDRDCKESSLVDRLLSFFLTTAGERDTELMLLERDRVMDDDVSFASDSVSLDDRDRKESA